MHAAEALTMAGHGEEVINALSGKLEMTNDDQHRCGLARELYRAGDKNALAVFNEVLTSQNTHGHGHACESLFKVGQTGDQRLLKPYFTDDSEPIKQLLAAAALANGDTKLALQKIRDLVEAKDDKVAGIAAWILTVHGNANDIDRLRMRMVAIERPQHKIFFTVALAVLGDQASINSLQEELDSQDTAIRTYAAEFCGRAGIHESHEALTTLLKDEEVDVRIRAAQSLLLLENR
ncbi:HEAT repeat domain-containing protein [Bremerella alba]|nr:hypothetical protein [Bremerella alba]